MSLLSAIGKGQFIITSIANDISSGSYHFHKVRAAFAGAFGILTSTAYLRAPLLSSRNRGRSRSHREDLSVLSALISVTQEVRLSPCSEDVEFHSRSDYRSSAVGAKTI